MSSKAEERALEAYPYSPTEVNLFGHKTITADGNSCDRAKYQKGYEQAEKDLGWHSVDESLPPIDEEVIVLAGLDVYSSPMKLCFGHRPNPDGWDAKSTLTGKMTHYTPETYEGWNIPGVKFWMPCPKIPEK